MIAAPPTLRILRREPTSNTTTRVPTPPNDADKPPASEHEPGDYLYPVMTLVAGVLA